MNFQERFLEEDNAGLKDGTLNDSENVNKRGSFDDYVILYIVIGSMVILLCIGFKIMLTYSSRNLSSQLPEAEKKLYRAVFKIEQIQAEKLLDSHKNNSRKRRLTLLQEYKANGDFRKN